MTMTADRGVARGDLVLDLAERGALLLLALWTIARLAPSIGSAPYVALLLLSEGLAAAFVLFRRLARSSDYSPYAATVAFVGTLAPLLVVTAPHPPILPAVGVVVMSAGLMLSIAAKMCLNRSFGVAAANRGIKLEGPYRFLRHPMYAGYFLTQAMFLLLNPCPRNVAVYAVSWSVQLLRIRAEEKLLLQDPAYRAYAQKVRFRLAPGIY